MFDKSKPMTLGDIFNTTFNLIKATFTRNVVIVAAFLIPVGIFAAYGFQMFFSTISDITKSAKDYESGSVNPSQIARLVVGFGSYFFAVTFFYLGNLAATIGVTKVSYSEMLGEKITLGDSFKKIFSLIYLRSIGQNIMLILACCAVFMCAVFVMAVAKMMNNGFLNFFGVLAVIAAVVIIIYLVFRWYFAFIAIVGPEKKVFESFINSSYLVKDYWWRTFGIVLLISIIVQFAESVISTPISFLFMWDFISQYFKMMAGGSGIEKDPALVFEMMKSFGFAIGFVIVLGTMLQTMLSPLFNVVMYFDLRIRKNDFEEITNQDDNIVVEHDPVE